LAREGADLVLSDLCRDLPTITYPLATPDDLAETARLVKAEGRRCIAEPCDVRDLAAMVALADRAAAELGAVHGVIANAGVSGFAPIWEATEAQWNEIVGTNLTGVFNTLRAAAPHLRTARWGRVVAVSSMMGRFANPTIGAYTASKWGVIGLVKSVAQDLAGFGVTVNAVAPGNIDTPMIHNEGMYRLMRPDMSDPTADDVAPVFASLHVQSVPWLAAEEVTRVVMFLVDPASEHLTGQVIDVSAGVPARFTA
jgi:NAD(P)-dependent dehydrogenase (short-subunit alcohol dehydrogenase family)